MKEFMDMSPERISCTLITKLVNITRNHENLSLFSSTEIQMCHLPASRVSARELNLIDKAGTDGAVALTASKKSLDRETPVRTEVTVCTSLLEIPQKHSLSSYQLLLHELLPYPSSKLSLIL